MMTRAILHIRIHSFAVLVERKMHPELATKPLVVAKPRGNSTGVVVSASREAEKLGVEDGMSVRQAQRTCPKAVVVMADFAVYRQVSSKFLDILARYSPLLEPDSLGSAYLDVTASRALFGSASEIAERITRQVFEHLELPVNIGCASNKLLAAMASTFRSGGICNPSRNYSFTSVAPGEESKFIESLPVKALDTVTPKIEKRLKELGVSTIGGLAAIPERLLVRQFGAVGSAMRRQSLGIDAGQVRAAYPLEVIKSEHMFENAIEEPLDLEEHLREMVAEALMALRKRGGLAGEIALEIEGSGERIADSGELGRESLRPPAPDPRPLSSVFRDLSGVKRNGNPETSGRNSLPQFQIQNSKFQIPISAFFRFKKPTDSASAIMQALGKMLADIMRPGMEVARAGIVLSDLTPGSASQLCLIGDGERKDRLDRTIELIRERFGDGSVFVASSVAPAGRAGVLSRIAA